MKTLKIAISVIALVVTVALIQFSAVKVFRPAVKVTNRTHGVISRIVFRDDAKVEVGAISTLKPGEKTAFDPGHIHEGGLTMRYTDESGKRYHVYIYEYFIGGSASTSIVFLPDRVVKWTTNTLEPGEAEGEVFEAKDQSW
ncbi:MAG: hypothetical protein IPK73_11245 [Candidatus Obscuribacter sp.]|nr:hypothetical protein [Candidatus Obscuribacter sp.]MBK9281593.1 hypothetical protein [Candidatus Obscuribacter sp.]